MGARTAIGVRLLLSLLALGCGSETSTGSDGATPDARAPLEACTDVGPAVVADIDETLTIDDAEIVMQLQDASYEPIARAGGAEMLEGYASLGYFILYLTARSEEMTLLSGETVRDATVRWLDEQGFPAERSRLSLAPTNAEIAGEPAAQYKAATLRGMQDEGYVFAYAYGNADSDVSAYAEAGIDPAATFIIGEFAGLGGTVAIDDPDWVRHGEEHLPSVAAVCVP